MRYHVKVIYNSQSPRPSLSHPNQVLYTDQVGPHPKLLSVVKKHLKNPWQKPCSSHTEHAFNTFLEAQKENKLPLILDSFCGTGMSTARIAEIYPTHFIVGIDQSAHRLARHQATKQENYILIQAEAEGFWKCLAENGIKIFKHWILYPNPWPKASQLRRRVHAHGAFPLLERLGGHLEMRTNWAIYAKEFSEASQLIGLKGDLSEFTPETPLTLFERKYYGGGQILWRFRGKFSN